MIKAALSLTINKLQQSNSRQLTPVRIDETNISDVRKAVKQVIWLLRSNKYISEYKPALTLGSTRCIADKIIEDTEVKLLPSETKEDLSRVLDIKNSYGDVDIDVEMLLDPRDIISYLESHAKDLYTGRLTGSKEINLAVRINSTDVVQIDLVDITGIFNDTMYFLPNQVSSFKDLQLGLRGVVRDAVSRSICRTTPIPVNTQHVVLHLLKHNVSSLRVLCKASDADVINPLTKSIRYSLGHTALKLVVDVMKVKPNGNIVTYNICIADLLDGTDTTVIGYDECIISAPVWDLSTVNSILGFTAEDTILHTCLMMNECFTMPSDRRQAIFTSVCDILSRKLPTSTRGGQLTNEEFTATVNYITPYLQNDNS